ncbi:MAG: hypothetical protein M3R47_12395, partial [Chloroflexota bacterium]|nr:hypothetical protein [Chloroflexota bacterium]
IVRPNTIAYGLIPLTGRGLAAISVIGLRRNYPDYVKLLFKRTASGHGVDCGIGAGCFKDYSGAKTLNDFQDMSWNERKRWIAEFASERDLDNWFDDMGSAIDFMISDPSLANEGGTAEVMDAAVLQAINDGWQMFKGKQANGEGGQGWANFFQARGDGITGDALIVARLQAEQYGVDYAWGLESTQSAYKNSSGLDQTYFSVFKGGADGYRSMASAFRSNPLAVNFAEQNQFLGLSLSMTDPRTSGPHLNTVGKVGYPFAAIMWSASFGLSQLGLP